MEESLHTLFLAQGMGLYLVIIAIVMLCRATYYKELILHLKTDGSTIVLSSTVRLMLGIALVLVHNVWTWESEVLITLVAWYLLIKSVLWLAIPELMTNYAKKLYSERGYYLDAIITGIIGVILMAHGFYLFTR